MTTFSRISPVDQFEKDLQGVDDFDLGLTAALLCSAQTELANLNQLHQDLLDVVGKTEKNRRYWSTRGKSSRRRKKRRLQPNDSNTDDIGDVEDGGGSSGRSSSSSSDTQTKFTSWEVIRDSISDRLFRRKYRMTKEQFNLLCSKIKEAIGDDEFRTTNTQALCGYTRVAIGLRVLCGGSYLDLIGRAYDVQSPQSIYNYFHTFIDWINKAFDYPWVSLLQRLKSNSEDKLALDKLNEISGNFAVDSNGSFLGCIGAIDGLAIRIICPTWEKDGVRDPGNFFCRKNFYALNVQAICDRQKRILWISPLHQGASHDSTAWAQTDLHDLLVELQDVLKKHGLFLVGDSAYPLSTHLLVPYPDAKPGTQQDAFNFWLSNSRIQIECTFGEFIARFGLFWRTLKFDMERCCHIIRAASKLHNFLIDCREGTVEDTEYHRNLSYEDVASVEALATPSTPNAEEEDDITYPLVTDNNAPKPTGRKDNASVKRQLEGEELRNDICTTLLADGNVRPRGKRMKYNAFGHAYFE